MTSIPTIEIAPQAESAPATTAVVAQPRSGKALKRSILVLSSFVLFFAVCILGLTIAALVIHKHFWDQAIQEVKDICDGSLSIGSFYDPNFVDRAALVTHLSINSFKAFSTRSSDVLSHTSAASIGSVSPDCTGLTALECQSITLGCQSLTAPGSLNEPNSPYATYGVTIAMSVIIVGVVIYLLIYAAKARKDLSIITRFSLLSVVLSFLVIICSIIAGVLLTISFVRVSLFYGGIESILKFADLIIAWLTLAFAIPVAVLVTVLHSRHAHLEEPVVPAVSQ